MFIYIAAATLTTSPASELNTQLQILTSVELSLPLKDIQKASAPLHYSPSLQGDFFNIRKALLSGNLMAIPCSSSLTLEERVTIGSINVSFTSIIKTFNALPKGPMKDVLLNFIGIVGSEDMSQSWTQTWASSLAKIFSSAATVESLLKAGNVAPEYVSFLQTLFTRQDGNLVHKYMEALCLVTSKQTDPSKQAELLNLERLLLSENISSFCQLVLMGEDGELAPQPFLLQGLTTIDEKTRQTFNTIQQAYWTSNIHHIVENDSLANDANEIMNLLDKARSTQSMNVTPALVETLRKVLFTQTYLKLELTDYLRNHTLTDGDTALLTQIVERNETGTFINSYVSTVAALAYPTPYHPQIELINVILRLHTQFQETHLQSWGSMLRFKATPADKVSAGNSKEVLELKKEEPTA